jgi:hypothetical protein
LQRREEGKESRERRKGGEKGERKVNLILGILIIRVNTCSSCYPGIIIIGSNLYKSNLTTTTKTRLQKHRIIR